MIYDDVVKKVCTFLEENEDQRISVKRYNKCLSLVPQDQLNFFEIFLSFQPQVTLEKFNNPKPETKSLIEETVVDVWVDTEMNSSEILCNEFENTVCKLCTNLDYVTEFCDYNEYKAHMESCHLLFETTEDMVEETETLMDIEEEIEIEPKVELKLKKKSVRTPHVPKDERHLCIECGYQFSNKSFVKAHQNGHYIFNIVSKITSFPTCTTCNFMFCEEESLRKHEICHELIPMEGIFLKPGKIRNEIIKDKEDFEMSSIKCGHCGKGFQSEESCRVHQYIFHVTNLSCPIENRSFNHNQAFTIHMKNNHSEIFNDETHFKCKICDSTFENLYEKLKHMKICDMKKIQCHHCDKKFSQKCFLTAHLREVSGATTVICSFCEKECKNKSDYNIHMRTHTNDKPFKCSLCPKSYKTSSARASHLETHNENGFLCNVCGQKFKARRILKKHFKNKHQEEC